MIEIEEFIKYFYNIDVNKISNKEDRYILESNSKKYMLVDYIKNPKKLYENYIIFKNSNMCCHDIILNKHGNVLSEYDGKNYLLLKKNINSNNNVTVDDILSNNIINIKNKFDIREKWELKNEYYENIISKLSNDNKYIKESFDYYIGLSELSINLLSYINFNNINSYVQHDRVSYNESIEEFYNPINMLVDSKIRDLALYLKSNFFNNCIVPDIPQIINKLNINLDEAILFISRMIYPDYYFDIIDEIVNYNINDDKLKECIKKSTNYEIFIKKIYKYLNQYYSIPKIDFLIK